MRVVYVDHCARLAGAEIALLRLLPELSEVEKHVILAEEGPLENRLRDVGVSVEVLPMREMVRAFPRELVVPGRRVVAGVVHAALYASRLAVRLARLKPDIVHTNSLKAALYGGLAARAARRPVIWHLRDRIAEDYLPATAVRLTRSMGRNLPDTCIAVSAETLSTLGAAANRYEIPARVILDPVPAPVGVERKSEGPLCVGMVGRMTPWKGQHIFLKAFARAFADDSARAVMIGAPLFGEERYESTLRSLSSELDLDGRCDFRGFREDIWKELASLDILVHASVIPEPGGTVVLEGMAAGVPVVASAAGSPTEVIEDGITGRLYRAGDAEALAGVLRDLASDASLRARLGSAAREKATEFAPAVVAEQVMEVYREVVASQGRGRR
jgi:glycosyltransferase involved in cell wall biosynthesis